MVSGSVLVVSGGVLVVPGGFLVVGWSLVLPLCLDSVWAVGPSALVDFWGLAGLWAGVSLHGSLDWGGSSIFLL